MIAELADAVDTGDHARRDRERATLDREIARLVEAIATSGQDLPPLLDALKARQARRTALAVISAASAVRRACRAFNASSNGGRSCPLVAIASTSRAISRSSVARSRSRRA